MLRIIATSQGYLNCVCEKSVPDLVDVQALVRGIPVSDKLNIEFRRDLNFALPILRFPYIDLPTTIDVLATCSTEKFNVAWPIESADDVVSLVGIGQFTVTEADFYHGALRGRIVNSINGSTKPILSAIVNNSNYKSVSVSEPKLLDVGGCAYTFEIPLVTSDLKSTGLMITVRDLRATLPIFTYSQAPIDPKDMQQAVVNVGQKLNKVADDLTKRIIRSEELITNKIAEFDERMSIMLEYLSSLVFDHPLTKNANEASPQVRSKQFLDEVDDVIEKRNLKSRIRKNLSTNHRVVDLDSSSFFSGWYAVEKDGAGDFRWMSADAVLACEDIDSGFSKAQLEVSRLFIGDQPALEASVDDRPCQISINPGQKPGSFLITLEWDEPNKSLLRLTISSKNAGIPKVISQSKDDRTLSLCVRRVTLLAS